MEIERKEILFDENLMVGFEALSIVDTPAIMENFIALSKEKVMLAKMVEGRIIGAVLIPEIDILRVDKTTKEPFNIFFSADTIKKIAYQMMRDGLQGKFTIQHDSKVENLTIVETWLIEDASLDKSKIYGFDLPAGTWMVCVEAKGEEIKRRIESGQLRGFSIEFNPNTKQSDEDVELAQELIKSLIGKV